MSPILFAIAVILGAVEHFLTAVTHALHAASVWTALLAVGAVFFAIRHYGAATLSDVGRILSAISKLARKTSRGLRLCSRWLTAVIEGKTQDIVDPTDAQIASLAKRKDKQRFGSFVALSAIAAFGTFALVAYSGFTVTSPMEKTERLKPPTMTKFTDRFGALYENTPPIGGPASPMASSLKQFSSAPSVSEVPCLSDPWNFPTVLLGN